MLQVDDRLTLAQDIEARLKDFEQKADLYAARERIFGLPPSEYPTLTGKNQAACANEREIEVHAARNAAQPIPIRRTASVSTCHCWAARLSTGRNEKLRWQHENTGRQFRPHMQQPNALLLHGSHSLLIGGH